MVTKYSMYDVIPSFTSLILFGIDLNCWQKYISIIHYAYMLLNFLILWICT